MKHKFIKIGSMFAMGAMMVIAASCAKEELDLSKVEVEYGPAKQIIVSAHIMSASSEKAHMDVNTREVLWDNGDQIRINNAVLTVSDIDGTNAQFAGSVSPNTSYTSNMDVYRAVFPTTLASSIPNGSSAISVTLPESQKLLSNQTDKNNYMAAITTVNSNENLAKLEFKNMCAIIKIGLKADPTATTDANTIRQVVFTSSDKNLSGAGSLSFNNDIPVLTMAPVSGGRADVHMDLTNNGQGGITLGNSYTYFYVMIPAATYTSFTMKVINIEGKAMQKTASNFTFQRSKVYTTETTMTVQEGYNPYEFELCDGTRFVFAPGNLQYQASTGKWRFAERSWDMIGGSTQFGGTATGNNTADPARRTQSAWIDLFGWGTSGWDAGNTNGTAQYLPTDWQGRWEWHSTSDYGAQYGPQGVHNLTGSYANSDWGIYNQISTYDESITYPAGTWRTPTGDEWRCIIDINNSRSAFAQIIGTNSKTGQSYEYYNTNGQAQSLSGLIIVPKGFIDPKPNGKVFRSVYELNRAEFADNRYTEAEMQALINAGAIFLPASGSRSARELGDAAQEYNGGIVGLYWSSTAYSSYEAESMRFENQTNQYGARLALQNPEPGKDIAFQVKSDTRRCFGQCVRLIKIVQ